MMIMMMLLPWAELIDGDVRQTREWSNIARFWEISRVVGFVVDVRVLNRLVMISPILNMHPPADTNG